MRELRRASLRLVIITAVIAGCWASVWGAIPGGHPAVARTLVGETS